MIREEYNLPLNRQAYLHLREKADGRIIQKTRYVIPLDEVTDSSPSQKESHLSPQFREKGVSLFLELDILKAILPHCFSQRLNFLTRKLHVTIRLLTGLVKMSHTCLCTTTVL